MGFRTAFFGVLPMFLTLGVFGNVVLRLLLVFVCVCVCVCVCVYPAADKPWKAHRCPKRRKLVAEPGFDPGTFGL